jgi:uncharacterized membrane protein YcaP (DUF421 family)
METYMIIVFRIVSIMLLLLFSTLFIMGKRPIGELPVFDLLSIIVVGAIVGADIAEPEIEHLPTAFAVVVLAVFQRVVSSSIIKSKKIRKLITFEPTPIISHGKLIYKNIKHISYTLDDILMLLREKSVFDISVVQFGIIEANGNLSILKKPENEPLTVKDMNIVPPGDNISYSIILDGNLQIDRIKELGLTEECIMKKLKQFGCNSYKEIFYASMTSSGEMNVSKYD